MKKNKSLIPQANNIITIYNLYLKIPTDPIECFNIESARILIDMKGRQGKYYLDSLLFLNLVEKVNDDSYILTKMGESVREESNSTLRFFNFIHYILNQEYLKKCYYMYIHYDEKTFKDLFNFYVSEKDNLAKSTIDRRFSTVKSWCKTIDELLDPFNINSTIILDKSNKK